MISPGTAPLAETHLATILSGIYDPSRVIGVIVCGSHSSGNADGMSDLDLVIVDSDGPMTQDTLHLPTIAIDVLRGTPTQLRNRLHRQDSVNNNFLLNSLGGGVVHFDRNQCASSLVAEARALRERGPTAISSEEYSQSRAALNRMLTTARTRSARSLNSREAAFLARYATDHVAIQAVYLYHRVRRRWTTGLPQLLRRISVEDPNLYALWTDYVDTSSQDQRLAAAAKLVGAAFQQE